MLCLNTVIIWHTIKSQIECHLYTIIPNALRDITACTVSFAKICMDMNVRHAFLYSCTVGDVPQIKKRQNKKTKHLALLSVWYQKCC